MRPGRDVDGPDRTRHDGETPSRSDGRTAGGGGRRPETGAPDSSTARFGRRSTDRLPTLASVATVGGGLSLAGTTLGTYGLSRLAPPSMETVPTLRAAFTGELAGHLLAAVVGLRVVRDLSIVLGGVAIVLGCWVAIAWTVRIAGRR